MVAIALLFSSITTPMLASFFSAGLWLIGHLSRDLRALGAQSEASSVAGVTEIRMTAARDEILYPPPEGASYLGFVFARGGTPDEVIAALRAAHARLEFVIEAPLTLVE